MLLAVVEQPAPLHHCQVEEVFYGSTESRRTRAIALCAHLQVHRRLSERGTLTNGAPCASAHRVVRTRRGPARGSMAGLRNGPAPEQRALLSRLLSHRS